MPQLLDATRPESILAAAARLAAGGLVALPTETVYGLAADGLSATAAARIFAAKGRPADHPLILHVADLTSAKALAASWPATAEVLAQACWPGPLTLVVHRSALVPDLVTGGQDSVAIRIPAHPVALRLLRSFASVGSGVLAAPSANPYGQLSPVRAMDVTAGLGDALELDDIVLDGGMCALGLESTIVDVRADPPRLLRPGGVSRGHLDQILLRAGLVPLDLGSVRPAPRVSGDQLAHYAPRMPLLLVEASDQPEALLQKALDRRAALPASEGTWMLWSGHYHRSLPPGWRQQMAPRMPEAFGRVLYAQLHDWQQEQVAGVVLESPPLTPAWEAVWDRLRRAVVGSQPASS